MVEPECSPGECSAVLLFACWQTLRWWYSSLNRDAESFASCPCVLCQLKEHAPPVGKGCNSTSAELQMETCQSVQLRSKNGNSCRPFLISAARSLVIRLVASVDRRCNTNSRYPHEHISICRITWLLVLVSLLMGGVDYTGTAGLCFFFFLIN